MFNREIHVWTPMIGFDRNLPDKGAAEYLARFPQKPAAITAFLFHIDIVLQHDGMDKVRILPPDNCSYYGSPRNEDRERQEWTNHDLRDLVHNLAEAGVPTYLGIMGVTLGNKLHHEWISDHTEVYHDSRDSSWSFNVLKHLADGSLFEDFFVQQLTRTLQDYGFAGVQLADNFCPQGGNLQNGDFSPDMVGQFLEHTGIVPPKDIADSMADNQFPARCLRGDWLWYQQRIQWIDFYAWRWESFWKKVADALHAIKCKIINLGMYCTDPFETYYCKGLDMRGMIRAGVDYLMPNIVPTGLILQHPDWGNRFHRYMLLASLTAAFVPDAKLLSLLGVKDATEEWDTLHHAPGQLERDIYTLLGSKIHRNGELTNSLAGLMVCLGDGIKRPEWEWLQERFLAADYDGAANTLAPALYWSNKAFDTFLPEYIATRRWSSHKFMYEMEIQGVLFGSVLRPESISKTKGLIFVPNMDLLPPEEISALAKYTGPVVATAKAEFKPQAFHINPEITFTDTQANFQLSAFAFNCNIQNKEEITSLLEEVDNSSDLDMNNVTEFNWTLVDTLPFRKVSTGFRKACAALLKAAGDHTFSCNLPILPTQLENGKYRLYILNESLTSYGYADVEACSPYKNVSIVSKYPVLPVKFMKKSVNGASIGFSQADSDGTQTVFRAKVVPGGATVLEITL